MALTAKRPSKGDATRSRLMQDVTDQTAPKKRLNAEIEDDLYRQIKRQMAEEGRSISEVTRELWIEYLSKNSNE